MVERGWDFWVLSEPRSQHYQWRCYSLSRHLHDRTTHYKAEILLRELSDDSSSPADSLQTYISSLPTPTAVSSAIQILVRMLLLYSAASRRCSHLLLGTSLTSLSISLISSISKGGGYSVSEEAHEEWSYRQNTETSDQTVRVIRPLRDIGSKECAFWAWWSKLKTARKHRYSGGRQDIAALTRGVYYNPINAILLPMILRFYHRTGKGLPFDSLNHCENMW